MNEQIKLIEQLASSLELALAYGGDVLKRRADLYNKLSYTEARESVTSAKKFLNDLDPDEDIPAFDDEDIENFMNDNC
jgi:hypothetical protein